MKHWFIEWLESKFEHELNMIAEYTEALQNKKPEHKHLREAFRDDEEMVEWIQDHEETAKRLKYWISLATDMISCGLEREFFSYYDAKQAIEPWLLPARPAYKEVNVITSTLDYLEERRNASKDAEEIKALEEIEATISELFSAGMSEASVAYYMRKIKKNPELRLQALELYLDQ